MKKLLVLGIIALSVAACGGNSSEEKSEKKEEASEAKTDNGNPSYDPNRGAGKFDKVDVSPALDVVKADSGQKVYEAKCSSCHKLTEEKLVGPGWKGVTDRHTAPWIMNFATNPDEMLNKDPKAQAMLEICLVRMPNQNLLDNQARDVYEFMRKNDGVK